MEKILFYGNCQLGTLARFFKKHLSDRFDVQKCTDCGLEPFWDEDGLFAVWSPENREHQHDFKNCVHTKIEESDIFVFQDHSSLNIIEELQTKFLHNKIATGLKICLPSICLFVYLTENHSLKPYIQYVKTKETNVSKIIKYLQESDDPKLTEMLKQEFPFNKTYQRHRNENSFRYEKDIEQYDIAIGMNDYIEQEYKNKILAYSHRHLTEDYYIELIRRLYKHLDINESENPIPDELDCPRHDEKINLNQFAFFENLFPDLDISRQNNIQREADLEKIVSEILKELN